MLPETLTSIAALVILGTILVPAGLFFIMNKINASQRKMLVVDLSSFD